MMRIRTAALATVFAASFAATGAMAQQRPDGQQVNPSPMPPGSTAGSAPGMGSTGAAAAAGAPTSQANPSPMPPGSTAGTAPGMNPGTVPGATAQTGTPMGTAQGGTADRGTPGGTGAMAPSGQPDVSRGTAQVQAPRGTTPPGSDRSPDSTTGNIPGTNDGRTGATTPNRGTTSGGADPSPPAATTQHTEPRTAAAPVAGSNSFTEGQARARMGDAGFNDVQSLRLDDQGIWRGRAIRNGQQTGVSLDYQGNVVATP
jgi:hypothetical protein